MGGNITIPEQDTRMTKAVQTFMFTPSEIVPFVKIFERLDGERKGVITIEDLLKMIDTSRSLFTDTLCEVLEVDMSDGEMNFCDFFVLVVNFCFFETPEILKLCIKIFDEDKAGFIDTKDVQALVNTLYHVKPTDKMDTQLKHTWNKIEFDSDDRVEFHELNELHRKFPRLFSPAFQMHNNMMIHIMGSDWWARKKQRLVDFKHDADEAIRKRKQQDQLTAEQKSDMKRQEMIRKRMGVVRYYMCPCLRAYFDPGNEDLLSLAEREKRARELARLRRQAELNAKNPTTHGWVAYEAKVSPEKGGSATYAAEKQERTIFGRQTRAEARADRKRARGFDQSVYTSPDDGFDTYRTEAGTARSKGGGTAREGKKGTARSQHGAGTAREGQGKGRSGQGTARSDAGKAGGGKGGGDKRSRASRASHSLLVLEEL